MTIETPPIQTTQKKRQTQEKKMNIEIIKRIMSEKKTILSSLRNHDWKTVKG